MRNKHLRMKLLPEEERFLRAWMHDEMRYQQGTGPAKRLQVSHGAIPADLAVLIAAAIPDPLDQLAASQDPPVGQVIWPWSPEQLRERVAEARACLKERTAVG